MNEFDLLSLIVDTAIKHGRHNQKLHGRRFGPDTGGEGGGASFTPKTFNRTLQQVIDAEPMQPSSGWSDVNSNHAKMKSMNAILDRHETHSLNRYTEAHFQEINGVLKGYPLKRGSIEEFEGDIANISSAFDKSRLPMNVMSHRGMIVSSDRLMELTRENAVISEKGFLSTSIDKDEAAVFGMHAKPSKPHRVLMNIVAPAGQRAIYMPDVLGSKVSNEKLLLVQREKELLFPANTKMLVRKSRKETINGREYTVIDVEVLPEDVDISPPKQAKRKPAKPKVDQLSMFGE